MINPKLKAGDRVVLLHMDGESNVPPGTWGTVKRGYQLFDTDQYDVDWDNGSTLSIIADEDMWDTKLNNRKKIVKEDEVDRLNSLMKNSLVFKLFNMKFLYKYLLIIKQTGIVNMFGAGDYLWMGKERIKHEFKYKDIPNEEAFEEMLDMADQAQGEMINGVIKVLEKEGKEETLSNINYYLRRYATKVIQNYVHLS
jgi:hypothetical protein